MLGVLLVVGFIFFTWGAIRFHVSDAVSDYVKRDEGRQIAIFGAVAMFVSVMVMTLEIGELVNAFYQLLESLN